MTTEQKAELIKRMDRLDFELRLRRYPAVLEADAADESEVRWNRHMTAEEAADYIDDQLHGR